MSPPTSPPGPPRAPRPAPPTDATSGPFADTTSGPFADTTSGPFADTTSGPFASTAPSPFANASRTKRWLYALKPASWPKLLVPALFGQALGYAEAGRFSPLGFLFGALYTACDLVFIVLLNDWGDRDVDALKRRLFPEGCSPKTIPDGILPARQVLAAGLAAGLALLVTALAAEPWLGRPGLAAASALTLAMFASYTFRPLALNYRGGGELLEMAGVGLVLPAVNAYLQSGRAFGPRHLALLPGFALLALASALASGLSDEVSDRQGGKVTMTTRFGNGAVRGAIEALVALGALAWAAAIASPALPWWALAPALAALAWHARRLRAASGAAITGAFRAQGVYKAHLHRAIWQASLWLAAAIAVARAIGAQKT
ncbi:MAG: UbiA family prenyltransferase [Polyangiaceae bacterium]|nr:UbiA family prenyltransferase [Polyangiaceae bacterium]